MGYWIIGSKSVIFLNKYHRNTHGTDKLIMFLKPLIPSLHYSIIPATRFSGRAGEL
jgi:hypothetical protein